MVLAIDTATRYLSLALHDGLSVVAETTWRTGAPHTVELGPQAALMLRRAGAEPGRLAGIAVALGPGSYTGLRIGLGFAKGLAFAHDLPLIGVPTFEIIMRAQPARDDAERALALVPAGRGRVLAAAYRWRARQSLWEPIEEARLLDWETLAAEMSEPTFVCGEVDATGSELLHQLRGRVTVASPAQSLRRAGYLAEIGWERLRRHQIDDPQILAPLYGGQLQGSAQGSAL